MRLDPELEAVVLGEAVWDGPSILDLTPEQVRAGALAVEPLEPIGETADLSAPGPNGSVPIRLYRPLGRRDATPVVFFHGGGWVLGSIEQNEDYCRHLANVTDRPVLSVEYRLAPEHKFPAGLEDSYAAVQWIDRNRAPLGIGAIGMAVAGDSAGGNLAASLCYLARQRGGPDIGAQILIYPVTSFSPDFDSVRTAQDGPWLTPPEMEWFANHYLRSQADALDPRAAPLLIEDLSGLPAALIITAQYDPLRDCGAAYADRLRSSGVPVRYHEYPGMVHGFSGLYRQVRAAENAFQEVAAFLDHLDVG